ncbi:conjugal transfer protein TraD [Escherichia coli]|nr:conjugal transfer protein TraD [Escherichia coli]
MTNLEEWLSAKIAYINGLKSPSEQQRLLVLLAEKKNRTTTDEKTLSALIRAEKTAEKAAAAKARVTAILAAERKAAARAERKAAARAERKARDHELYKAAGLMIVAGLVDSKTGKPKFNAAELVGALAGVAELPRNHPKWQEWEKRGKELLTKDGA